MELENNIYYTDEYFMSEALKEAKKASDKGEVPVGAVIVLENEIIARGRNRRESLNNALCHAEIEAINNACEKLKSWRLLDCKLYVTLEPCNMCKEVIRQSRIHEVYYLNKSKFNNEIYNNITISEIEGYNFEKDNYLLKLKQFFINKR